MSRRNYMHYSKQDLLSTIIVLHSKVFEPMKLSKFCDYEEMNIEQLSIIVDQLIQKIKES